MSSLQVMRKELKKRGIMHLKVLYSREKPIEPLEVNIEELGMEKTEGAKTQHSGKYFFCSARSKVFLIAGEVIRS